MPKLIKEVCGAIVSGALIVWVGAMLLTNDPCERLSRFDWMPAAAVNATVFVVEPFMSKGTAAGVGDSLNVVRNGMNGIFSKVVLRKSTEELKCSAKKSPNVQGDGEARDSASPGSSAKKVTEIDEARELLNSLKSEAARQTSSDAK